MSEDFSIGFRLFVLVVMCGAFTYSVIFGSKYILEEGKANLQASIEQVREQELVEEEIIGMAFDENGSVTLVKDYSHEAEQSDKQAIEKVPFYDTGFGIFMIVALSLIGIGIYIKKGMSVAFDLLRKFKVLENEEFLE